MHLTPISFKVSVTAPFFPFCYATSIHAQPYCRNSSHMGIAALKGLTTKSLLI